MRSMLVIGLGRFGQHLAVRLAELGNEVMAIDKDEEAVRKVASTVTAAQIGDCMDIEVLKSLGVRNFDVCFVCIGENFQSSLEIASQLKDLGAGLVVAKADRDIHAKFLLKIGADEIIYPERDMAFRAAMRYSIKRIYDYIELTPEYAIVEMEVPDSWVGKNLAELSIRSRYSLNVIGTKREGKMLPMTDTLHVFEPGEHIVVAGSRRDMTRLVEKK